MEELQNFDAPVYKRNSLAVRFLQIVGVSVLWLICCVPIVTIGPASCALYYVTAKTIRHGHGKLWQNFIGAMRADFRISALYGTSMALLAALLVFFSRLANTLGAENSMWRILGCAYGMMLILTGCFAVVVFPVLSRFRFSGKLRLKFPILFTLKHLFTAFTCLLVWYLGISITMLFPACLLFVPCVCTLICSMVLEPLLKKYAVNAEEESSDQWYME